MLRRYGAGEAVDVHEFHQIVFGLDGTIEMAVEGTGARIDAGSAWLVPAGARHAYAGLGENRQLVLDLPCGSLAVPERLFDKARVLRLDTSLSVLVGALGRREEGIARREPPACTPRHFHWLAASQLCGALLGDGGHAQQTGGLPFAAIDRWLRAHLAEPLRIADLAAQCGLGPRRFHALFNEALGETPHQYLNKLRLDTALTELDDMRRPLAEIAARVGFADQSAFTRAFTRRFGQAPGRWRAAPLRPHIPDSHASPS